MSKSYFKTKKLVTLAILSALGSALMWLEIPFIPPFKLDPSDIAVIIGVILYGPVGAIVVALIKAIIHFILLSSGDFGIGELIAFTASLSYALPFYYALKIFRKIKFKNVVRKNILIRLIPSIVGTLALTIILPLLNFLVFYQLYAIVVYNGFAPYHVVLDFSIGVIPGNIIKGAGLSILFIILSIRLDYVVDKLSDDESNQTILAIQ